MCNKGIAHLSESEDSIQPHQSNQAVNLMDSPRVEADSAPVSNDDGPRFKFLCSFLGSIMPRPQDGKLRYVGGETRIVSLPREISCAELMQRMRDLYEEAVGLKYQQLDEDLDALVSVVNDDDVTNMMEEYEKLGSGDAFTRLRIFLFAEPEHDSSSRYVDGHGIGTERRYVDALNNMDDASDFRRPPRPESPRMSPMDDLYATEQFLNLHNINVPPHMVSGQLQQLVSQRYSEMEAPWNPAYYSPSHHGKIDPRLADIPYLPSAVYETPIHDRGWVLQHQLNSMVDDARTLVTGAGRLNDHYIVDGLGMNVPPGHGSVADVHQMPSNYHHHHKAGPELSTEIFHEQIMAAAPHKNIPPHVPGPVVWRNVQSSGHGSPSYEASTAAQHLNNPGSPRSFIGEDSQNPHIESSPKMMGLDENIIAHSKDGVVISRSVNSNVTTPVEEKVDLVEPGEKDLHASVEDLEQFVNHVIPELVASMKKVALEGIEEVKAKAEGSIDSVTKQITANELEPVCANGDSDVGSENGNVNTSKIEPTKAEAEAIARGLQTINNDDLEEIRELGSGTYGAVYHGKWRGSDVAIKRIKASCFAGKPSHRERLIADFWKEALILSSLHHPNVISFYGIVRDGPDGSLATVTEFMVNGSLKQFLQKKERTIDRRKRLIIAMDAAFGMEYLHGKNIVHFDLKCENLLVNMRDPQRPVCKIGDLGLSKVKQCTLVSGGVRGTLPWMAPELLSGKCDMVTEKIDVYSFAIVMWELLTGDEPYADMHCAGIIGGIVNNTLRPQIPTWCDPEWKTLMQSCWASDPAERPSFSHISEKLRTMAAAINVK